MIETHHETMVSFFNALADCLDDGIPLVWADDVVGRTIGFKNEGVPGHEDHRHYVWKVTAVESPQERPLFDAVLARIGLTYEDYRRLFPPMGGRPQMLAEAQKRSWQKHWDKAVAEDTGWVLLPHEHPEYWVQQAFSEVACRSQETDPDKLFALAIEDYEGPGDPRATDHIRQAFRKWSKIQAANNDRMNNDPWMQGLSAAEKMGKEATDKFLKDNPNGPFEPLGKEPPK